MERYGAIESVLRAEIVELEQALDAAHKRIGDLDYELHHKWESDTFCDEKVGGKIGYVPYIPLAKRLEQQLADAQAQIEALQAVIRQMGEQAAVLAKEGMAAKQQVEALQRERDTARRRVDELEAREVDVVLLRGDLDDERDRLRDELDVYRQAVQYVFEAITKFEDLQRKKAALTPAGGER